MRSLSGLAWVVVLASGCRCSESAEPPLTSASSTRLVVPPARCSELPGTQFSVESPGLKVEPDEIDAPFSVELGRALAHSTGYVVPLLRGDSRATSAVIVRLDLDGKTERTRLTDLGPVHSSVPAPKVAGLGADLLVALPDADASGGEYRVGKLSGEQVTWFGEVDEHGDDSPAFDLAAAGDRWLLTWDDWEPKRGKGVVLVASAVLGEPIQPSSAQTLSPETTDAQSPRALVRPGGYWLSWIALGPAKKAAPKTPEEPTAEGEDDAPLAAAASWLELVRVDQGGKAESEVLQLTPREGHVSAYDVVAAHDGRLLFAVRDDGGGAEFDDARIAMIRVGVDGSVERDVMPVEDLGASAPSLLFDPKPGDGAPHGWLALASVTGATMLAGLTPWGAALEAPATDDGLSGAGVLAALQGQLLVARPRGRDLRLELVRCQSSPAPSQ
jgi:hypothetical protein